MKAHRILSILSVALLAGVSAFAQPGKCLPARTDGVAPYVSGENLSYSISYNWYAVQTDVGKGNFFAKKEVLNGETLWHTGMRVQTAPFFDAFFKIRETFDSWFSLDGKQARQFNRDSREGDYHAVNRYRYDRAGGVIHATLDYRDQGETTKDIPYGPCTYDLTMILYVVRQMDFTSLKDGQAFSVSFAIDDEVQPLRMVYKGRENKYVKGIGTVATRKFAFAVNQGDVFGDDGNAILWLSDDDNRIPIAFMAPLKVGAMNGRLSSYDNLANEFSSLISTKKVK